MTDAKKRIRDPKKVRECLAECRQWEGQDHTIFDAYALYHSNYDVMSKHYPKFKDYWMNHHNWTDVEYSKQFKDNDGNRQTIMRPVLDDNDHTVYRMVEESRYMEINKFCSDS